MKISKVFAVVIFLTTLIAAYGAYRLGSYFYNTSDVQTIDRDDTPMLILKRTACYGVCPVYNIHLYCDGTLYYEGKENVKKLGIKTKLIKEGDLLDSEQLLNVKNFARFNSKYSNPTVTDMPSISLEFKECNGSYSKSINYYLGDLNAPENLGSFVKEIEVILQTQEFTGIPYEELP
jgi:hypothetical protein